MLGARPPLAPGPLLSQHLASFCPPLTFTNPEGPAVSTQSSTSRRWRGDSSTSRHSSHSSRATASPPDQGSGSEEAPIWEALPAQAHLPAAHRVRAQPGGHDGVRRRHLINHFPAVAAGRKSVLIGAPLKATWGQILEGLTRTHASRPVIAEAGSPRGLHGGGTAQGDTHMPPGTARTPGRGQTGCSSVTRLQPLLLLP